MNSPSSYLIIVEGCLESNWMDWFEGFTLSQKGGCTRLFGTVPDQSALFGVLARIRDLGLPLLSLNRIEELQDGQDPC